MGITDLFKKNDEQSIIKAINDRTLWISEEMYNYYQSKEFQSKVVYPDDLIINLTKGELLYQYENAEKDVARGFFKEYNFRTYAYNAVVKIYNLCRLIDTPSKRHPEIAKGAQESLDKIDMYYARFNPNIRK